jgi:acetyl-CoA carboxylase beta subunit
MFYEPYERLSRQSRRKIHCPHCKQMISALNIDRHQQKCERRFHHFAWSGGELAIPPRRS